MHPSDRDLLAFADTGDSAGTLPRVRRHLADCQRCRDHVAFVRQLSAAVPTLPGPIADERLLASIRDRVTAHERVLLPAEMSPPLQRSRRWMAAASVIVAIGGAWIFLASSAASAGTSTGELTFSPPRIQPASIDVRYRPAGLFPGADHVVLRARYRTEWGEPYQQTSRQHTAAILTRDSRGDFHGSLRIPDSVVYAAFSVEDERGLIVDDNAHQLWYLIRKAPDGRPLLNALEQRSNDLYGENLELSMRVLQEESRVYPDSPAVWGGVAAIERFMLGQARADSSEPQHCERLGRFDSYYRERMSVSPHDADAMVKYSVQIDRSKCPAVSPIGRYWQDRVLNDSSGSVESRARRYSRELQPVMNDPARSVALAEKYWPLPGQDGTMLANNGAMAALRGSDGASALKWVDRSVQRSLDGAPFFYSRLVGFKDVHQVALDRLRSTLRRLQSRQDSLRPLELSVAQQARLDSATVGQVLAAIGKALVADGQMKTGRDTLILATERGWDARLFRDVAQQLRMIGDTVGEIRLLARIVADPSTGAAALDSISRVAATRVPPEAWRAMVDSARMLLRTQLLADAVSLPIKGRVRLQALDGHKTDLTSLGHGRVTVVSFWSRTCGFSVQQFPMLTALARQLDEHGIALVPVFNEKPSPDMRKYVAGTHVSVPVFSDTWGEATRTFHDFGTPIFFVVDQAGRVRYRYTSLAKVLTQAVAIQQEATSPR
jgi:thiol-disulfide isomerase/thioredoxin